ncbi:hypothetical protein Ahy_A03g014063 [Arachis hypogaea]|uniref:DUF4218 domain-containing protein n=1 Tax=Arachis hypogaea TaxID=3818 RepID=A0A445DWW4_ARAHY|nr:hypothetical protein Ahy_A03g014063 [Arachis hypogaea]
MHLNCETGPEAVNFGPEAEKRVAEAEQLYARNRVAPEGSIAEGYLSNEILTFCPRYLDNVESRINRPLRVDDRPSEDATNNATSMFPLIGKAVGASESLNLSPTERLQAHRHIHMVCSGILGLVEKDSYEVLAKETKPTLTGLSIKNSPSGSRMRYHWEV